MGRMSHRNQERTERRISAAASLMLCALTVLAQIAVTLLLTRFLKEKASFVYGFLQLIGAAVAIRVYQRSGSPSYKLSWMCLLLILPVAGMLLFCLWGGTHQAKQLSLKPVPPIPQRESAKMLSDLNQTALTRRSPAWGRLAAYLQKRQFWLYRNTDAAYFGEGESFFRDLVEHLRQAETYIFMEYYILAEGTVWDEIFAVLKERAAAGVDVRLMIPAIPDKKLVYLVAETYWGDLLRHGVKIYKYTPGFVHAKSAMADREAALIGSTNMDYRSFQLHYEDAVMLYHMPVIEELLEDMDHIVEDSQLYTLEDWENRPWLRRMTASILKLGAIWL